MSLQPMPHHESPSHEPAFLHRQSWVQIARPLTLTGTISPIIAGTIIASYKGHIHIGLLVLLIAAAVLVQASANILNDYFDFANGQDRDKWLALTDKNRSHTGPRHKVLPFAAAAMLTIAGMLGIWLAANSHPSIILIGMIGVYAGYKYSAGGKRSLSALGLGEATAAIFLGFVPVVLAFIVQGHSLDSTVVFAGLPFALLISIMILTNNIRDIDKDTGFRQTIAIRLGKKRAVQLLGALLISVYLIVSLLVITQILPWTALFILLAAPVACRLIWSYRRNATRPQELLGMKRAAQHHWLFSLLLIIGLLV